MEKKKIVLTPLQREEAKQILKRTKALTEIKNARKLGISIQEYIRQKKQE